MRVQLEPSLYPYFESIHKQALSEFLTVEQDGEPIIAPDGTAERGKNSNLIKVLRGEPPYDGPGFPMPRRRPAIAPDLIAFIEKWIDDGCPLV